jgi:hypothetical protein
VSDSSIRQPDIRKLTPRPEHDQMRKSEAADLVEVSSMQIDGTSVACQILANSGSAIFTQ